MSDLDDLDAKIKKARHIDDKPSVPVVSKDTENSRAGVQAGFELVGSIVICTALGYGVDQWLNTSKPIFMLIFFFLGVCVGFVSVYRISQNLGSNVGYSQLHKTEKNANTATEKQKNHGN